MNTLYIILAIISIPLIFLTLYAKTEKGQKVKLGSYFLIRDFSSRIFRVRSLNDKLLLITRLAFAVIIAIMVFNPLNLETPDRESVLHRSREGLGASTAMSKFKVKLDIPGKILDSFDEDIFFLESLAENLSGGQSQLTIIYNPDSARLDKQKGDIVVFPGLNQNRDVLNRWAEIFYLSDLLDNESKIKGSEYVVKKYIRPVIVDEERVSIYSSMENEIPIAFSFKENLNSNERRVLFFTTGMAETWGDAGLSGIIMDTIAGFQRNISLSDEVLAGNPDALKNSGRASGRLPHRILFYIALLFFVIELLLFIYRFLRFKRKGIAVSVILVLLFSTTGLHAGGFTFIELDANTIPNKSNRLMFSIIKREAERRTSVRINPVYYKKISTRELARGRMPELPYLWIIGCKGPNFFSKKVKQSLSKFMDRGGIVFIDTCGSENDSDYLSEINDFILGRTGYNPNKELLPKLPPDHPIYKSFYLLPGGNFFGIDVSRSTKRTALIVTRGSFKSGILRNDSVAIRTGINVLLYMLSGNYKSDQIHTRQILKKLKKRELYR
ncbi:MAG: DUF4159 domain-containing protein [bacterium]|nr:DUF4159 domain-containing protein [bacterium]